jgi:hypothetical protein
MNYLQLHAGTCPSKIHVNYAEAYKTVHVNNKVLSDNGCNHVLCFVVIGCPLICTCQQLGYNGLSTLLFF